MIILDTNIVSETMLQVPNESVVSWLDAQTPEDLYLCAPVLAELHYGVARLPESGRKRLLAGLCNDLVTNIFSRRILPFDSEAAAAYGDLVAKREQSGRPISVVDGMIAAIATARGATLATRNIRDFGETGLALINPYIPI